MVNPAEYKIEYGPIAGSPHCGWWAVNVKDPTDYHGPYADATGADDAIYEMVSGA